MIPFLTPLILRLLGDRFKPLAVIASWALVLGAVWLFWTLWLANHDEAVVQADRDKANLEVVKSISKADRAADAKEGARVKEFQTEQEGLRNEAAKGDETLAGPGTRAVFDGMRSKAN